MYAQVYMYGLNGGQNSVCLCVLCIWRRKSMWVNIDLHRKGHPHSISTMSTVPALCGVCSASPFSTPPPPSLSHSHPTSPIPNPLPPHLPEISLQVVGGQSASVLPEPRCTWVQHRAGRRPLRSQRHGTSVSSAVIDSCRLTQTTAFPPKSNCGHSALDKVYMNYLPLGPCLKKTSISFLQP